MSGEIEVTSGVEDFETNSITIRYEAAMVPVTTEIMRDSVMSIMDFTRVAFDRMERPWAYPDRPPSWTFEPFPRFTAMQRRTLGRVRRIRSRWGERIDRFADAARGGNRPGMEGW